MFDAIALNDLVVAAACVLSLGVGIITGLLS